MTRILVAESSKMSRDTVEHVLGLEGYKVFSAESGEDLGCKVFYGNPHIVVTTAWLEGKPVLEVLKGIRAERVMSHIKVVVYTRNYLPDQLRIYREWSHKVVVQKPDQIHHQELLRAIRELSTKIK